MCYYLYGSLYGEVDENEYKKIEGKYEYKIRNGTKHDVKLAVQDVSDEFRVTDWYCDCDSDIGKMDPEAEQVRQFEALFNDIKNVEGARHIYLCKTWAGKSNKKEIKMNLNDIDIKTVLAGLEKNCLYIFEV